MAPSGDFQAVFDLVIVYEGGDHENGNRLEYSRGEKVPARVLGKTDRDRYLDIGAIRPYDESAELPGSNSAAEAPALTQPNGDPVELTDGVEVESGFKAANTHAEADAMAATAGISFPNRTKLDDKNTALEAFFTAQAENPGATPPTTDDLSELSDDELIQRGIDFGHTEEEMAELSHDELVLFVAEAQNRYSDNAQRQDEQLGSGGNAANAVPPAE